MIKKLKCLLLTAAFGVCLSGCANGTNPVSGDIKTATVTIDVEEAKESRTMRPVVDWSTYKFNLGFYNQASNELVVGRDGITYFQLTTGTSVPTGTYKIQLYAFKGESTIKSFSGIVENKVIAQNSSLSMMLLNEIQATGGKAVLTVNLPEGVSATGGISSQVFGKTFSKTAVKSVSGLVTTLTVSDIPCGQEEYFTVILKDADNKEIGLYCESIIAVCGETSSSEITVSKTGIGLQAIVCSDSDISLIVSKEGKNLSVAVNEPEKYVNLSAALGEEAIAGSNGVFNKDTAGMAEGVYILTVQGTKNGFNYSTAYTIKITDSGLDFSAIR